MGRARSADAVREDVPRRIGVCAALCFLVVAVVLAVAPSTFADSFESEREAARALGAEGYEYGEPLLDSVRIYKSITSVKAPNDFGSAPFNQFSHFKALATEKEGCVVAPNADTLYSIAVLKMKSQPVVMHVPSTDRFSIAELLSPYTENFALIGQGGSNFLAPGDYIIAGPGQLTGEEEADGLKVVHSPYDEAWVIGRTLVKDQADLPNALAVEEARKIVPLKKWLKVGDAYEPKTHGAASEGTCSTVPGTVRGESRLRYWKALSKALTEFPPPAADDPILERLAADHIGPGMTPSKSDVSAGTLEGLEEAIQAGQAKVEAMPGSTRSGLHRPRRLARRRRRAVRDELHPARARRPSRARRTHSESGDLPGRAHRSQLRAPERRHDPVRRALPRERFPASRSRASGR